MTLFGQLPDLQHAVGLVLIFGYAAYLVWVFRAPNMRLGVEKLSDRHHATLVNPNIVFYGFIVVSLLALVAMLLALPKVAALLLAGYWLDYLVCRICYTPPLI